MTLHAPIAGATSRLDAFARRGEQYSSVASRPTALLTASGLTKLYGNHRAVDAAEPGPGDRELSGGVRSRPFTFFPEAPRLEFAQSN